MPANMANQPKCSAASSGDFETTGMFSRRPITSAIVLERHALFGDGVERAAVRAALQRQPIDAGGVEPVHGRPAVVPVADIGGDAFLAREADEHAARSRDRRGHEPTAAAGRSSPARRAPPAPRRRLRSCAERLGGGARRVGLGRDAARRQQRHARGDEQRPVGAFQRRADRLDGAPVVARSSRRISRNRG